MKKIETPDTIHLESLINELGNGKYVIPDFQREFEWQPWDVVALLKSIFEDYYIGTLLFWKASKENQSILGCEPIYGFEGKSRPDHIILDGQQRLSALYYALFAPNKPYPNRKSRNFFFVKLEEMLNGNFEEAIYYEWNSRKVKRIIDNKEEQYQLKLFPLLIFGQKARERIRWLEGYEKYWSEAIGQKNAEKERDRIEDFFEELLDKYEISYIELDRDIEISKVCDIFTRINSTGIQLTIFDLLNALLRPREIKLKEMWRKVSEAENMKVVDENKMKVYVLQTMSILRQNYCSPKYLYFLVPNTEKVIKQPDGTKEKKVLITSSDEFIELWSLAVDNMISAVDIVKNPRDLGAIKPNFIPYPTMLPIIAALNSIKEQENFKNNTTIENKIRKWYWSSIFTKNYSSSVESQMTKDFKELKDWFTSDQIIPDAVKQCEREIEKTDLKNEIRQASAIYKAIFNLLVINGARDWISQKLPEYAELNNHHIVPKNWGKKKKIRNIDSILNRTPLTDKTNKIVIGDKLPNVYLKKIKKQYKNGEAFYNLMESHLISRKAVEILLRKDFSASDFEEFVEEREKSIIEYLKNLLDITRYEQTGLITPVTPFSNIKQLEEVVKKSSNYLYWIDKYFSRAGLDIISNALEDSKDKRLKEIKIITSIDKVEENLRNRFKDLAKELKNKGVAVRMHVLTDKKLMADIHDRWILTEGTNFNIPSTDTASRGQYSEIKETKNRPPFEDWWEKSLDIINDWSKILKVKSE